ncbi:MAG: single-stranded-DNA-specific exonuclease RecJ [bacterium]
MKNADWKILDCDRSLAKRFEHRLGLSELASRIFVARGFRDEKSVQEFVSPTLENLAEPILLPDAEVGVSRLIDAVIKDEVIMVLGHDDVDGVTSTAIVFGALKEISADVYYYIPDSPSEGLGLSRRLIDSFKSSGISLVVTVDCGVSCLKEIEYAKSLGIETIVTDHHEPPEKLPDAVAVIDPKRGDSKYPFRDLAGCGVAYRFIQAFSEAFRRVGSPPSLDSAPGMAALGSFADRVPLIGENRSIVFNGTKEVLTRRLVPFLTLRSHILVDDDTTMTGVLSRMTPIIGSSRSHDGGNLGCELLLADQQEDADEIITKLIMESEQRRERAQRALEIVEKELARIDFASSKAVVIVVSKLPTKSIGFCAARLADRLHKPVVLISVENNRALGELRGPKGVDLVAALSENKEYFISYGGHKQAAGFSMESRKVEQLVRNLNDYFDSQIDPDVIKKQILVDAKIKSSELNLANMKSLLVLEPFGEDNPRPILLIESLNGGTIKKVDSGWQINDVYLSTDGVFDKDFGNDIDDVCAIVSPFGDGDLRVVEVLDWRRR